MSSPPINTTLNTALYTIATGTTQSNPFINVYSNRNPTQFDINYPIQKRWINFLTVEEWILKSFSNTTGVTTANWVLLSTTGNALVEFTGTTNTTGFPVDPNAFGQINLRSSNSTILIEGNNTTHDINFTVAQFPSSTVTNLGISYSAGTFSINAADGSNLSATNTAHIILPSNVVPGRLITYEITANASFIDSTGLSTIVGNTFGFTSLLDNPFEVPFFVYAVSRSDDQSLEFMISRFPNSKISPIAAKIGQIGINTQGSFFSLNPVISALFASTSCLSIGCFRMVKVGAPANDDWTVQALNVKDGIGNFFEDRGFAVVPGQFGTATGSLFFANGGTAPIYTNQAVVYVLDRFNFSRTTMAFSTNTTPGLGAVDLRVVTPYVSQSGASIGIGDLSDSVGPVTSIFNMITNIGNQFATFNFTNPSTSGTLKNADATATAAINGSALMGIAFI